MDIELCKQVSLDDPSKQGKNGRTHSLDFVSANGRNHSRELLLHTVEPRRLDHRSRLVACPCKLGKSHPDTVLAGRGTEQARQSNLGFHSLGRRKVLVLVEPGADIQRIVLGYGHQDKCSPHSAEAAGYSSRSLRSQERKEETGRRKLDRYRADRERKL